MKSILFIIITALILVNCETNIFGPNEGTVTGSVVDIYGNPVAGATVKITYFETNKDGNQVEKSMTRASDASGIYVADVPLAEIGILISKNGYKEVSFYDYLEQDKPKRSFSTIMHGNPSVSNLNVSNNPVHTQVNDTIYFSFNIEDEYKFKKQEPYWALLFLKSGSVTRRTYEIEVPFFSSSFKLVHNKVDLDVDQEGDILKTGTYSLEVIVSDPDELKSDTAFTTLNIN